MIPILYEWDETIFHSNGICRLIDCISATVTEIRNGEYTCQFVYPIDGVDYDKLQLGRIVGCPHDAAGDVQPFTIYRREANLDGTEVFYAQHLSYELNYVVQRPFTANGADGVFEYLDTYRTSTYRLGGRVQTYSRSPYRFSTDIESDADYNLLQPTALRVMLGGMQNSILEVYGGELEWDRYNVILHANRGQDNGAVIRYGGNLTGAVDTDDDSATYGSVHPFWVDKTSGTVVDTYGDYRQGSEAIYFPWKFTPLDVSQNFETQPTRAEVQEVAEAFLANNQTWLPFHNLTVNFEPWTDAQIAAESERLQNVRLCDYVRVDILWMGVSVKSKVTKTVWNVLTDRYDSIELGDLNPSYGSVIAESSGGKASSLPFNKQALIDEILEDVYATVYQKAEVIDLIYPVGSLFFSSSNTNPGTYLGGTWEAYAKGRTLIGVGIGTDGTTTMRFTEGDSGGEYKHTLTVAEMPAHNHSYNRELSTGSDSGVASARFVGTRSSMNTGSTGGGEAHNNLQPYVAVYIWRRTA